MTKIAVIDHGAGNLVSISQGLAKVGAQPEILTNPDEFDQHQGIVLPGVGATSSVMAGIRNHGFEELVSNTTLPLLGICVGMQVLFDFSHEDDAVCLGMIKGSVNRLQTNQKLPHIGWNQIKWTASLQTQANGNRDNGYGENDDRKTWSTSNSEQSDRYFYFVHSYAPVPDDQGVIAATSTYENPFAAAVRQDNLFGVQFHPERSGEAGLSLLSDFVQWCQRSNSDLPSTS